MVERATLSPTFDAGVAGTRLDEITCVQKWQGGPDAQSSGMPSRVKLSVVHLVVRSCA
jgi:hypothetical protein